MIKIRPAASRGLTRTDWLDSRHTFSFNRYYDPEHMGFRKLRVINDDRVAAGGGFPTHGHRDMEILTWVLEGSLEHRDSLGHARVIRAGELQRMSAGTGVTHSEYNHSQAEPARFLQIWILPRAPGGTPEYEQRPFPVDERRARLLPIAAADGRDGAVTIHQDVGLYVASLAAGQSVEHLVLPGRHAWIQVATGAVDLNRVALGEGDGARASDESRLEIRCGNRAAEVLLFDLA